MQELQFECIGNPVGKARPRVTRKGITYTPKKSRDYEKKIQQAFLKAHPDFVPTANPIQMQIFAYYPIMKSWSKKKKELALQQQIVCGKPDLDNVGKSVLDALNKILYVDDKQITDLVLHKEFSLTPRVEVKIKY